MVIVEADLVDFAEALLELYYEGDQVEEGASVNGHHIEVNE